MGSKVSEAVYEKIGAKYGIFKTLPTELIETSNLKAAITPRIAPGTGARALDLACGTGFYTRKLVEDWGFASAVGVDVSPTMVNLATQLSTKLTYKNTQSSSAALQFQVGDALALGRLDEGPFDLVLGNWFLNYASTEEELTAMFQSISTNLTNGGSFVGIAYPPTPAKEIDAFGEKENSVNERRKISAMRISVRYIERNQEIDGGRTPEGGWRTEVTAYNDDEERSAAVQFGNYHLPKELYERAARNGGLKGRLEWVQVKLLDHVREKAVARCGEKFWKEYFGEIGPHFSLLVVEKGEKQE
ncbi:methyltransferase [Naviculisporaceae sp. PSN 640]